MGGVGICGLATAKAESIQNTRIDLIANAMSRFFKIGIVMRNAGWRVVWEAPNSSGFIFYNSSCEMIYS